MTFEDWVIPCEKTVKYFANVFDIANYKTENELIALFSEVPTAENIKRRVNRLSAIYGTRISKPDQDTISDFIFSDGIVGKAKTGELDVVNRLAFNGERKYRKCLSFASKFCSFCNPDLYPIYDSLVLESLLQLNKKEPFDSTYDEKERNQIKYYYNYKRFCELIDNFRKYTAFGLGNCTLRELDKYLWIAGKGLED
ncbi:MAG: hypothetical protein K5634_06500 [Sphaerochaetaceae bacterium]|nr:hypothetical protein [Sphaerochaetaceae bacterium]